MMINNSYAENYKVREKKKNLCSRGCYSRCWHLQWNTYTHTQVRLETIMLMKENKYFFRKAFAKFRVSCFDYYIDRTALQILQVATQTQEAKIAKKEEASTCYNSEHSKASSFRKPLNVKMLNDIHMARSSFQGLKALVTSHRLELNVQFILRFANRFHLIPHDAHFLCSLSNWNCQK